MQAFWLRPELTGKLVVVGDAAINLGKAFAVQIGTVEITGGVTCRLLNEVYARRERFSN